MVKQLRPWMQYLQWRFLADAGEKAVVGRHGWLFYRPSVRYVIERQTALPKAIPPILFPRSDRSAISSRRGESGCWSFRCPTRRASIPRCSPGGQKTRESSSANRRVVCSISWSSAASSTSTCSRYFAVPGRRRAGRIRGGSTWRRTATGRRRVHGWPPALSRGECSMEAPSIGVITLTLERSVTVRRHGDLVEMLQVPQIERALEPESLACLQVVQSDTGTPYRDAPESEVLILGDSFLRIYEQDEPGAAGFIAHLARELGQPLTSIVNDGGASTLVRQELARRPTLLLNKRLVIWEFAERDIRYGTEGWQIVPLARSKTTPR